MAFKRRQRILYLDTESRCELDIRKTNAYRYVEHPSFDLLMIAWALDDEPVRLADTPADLFDVIPDLVDGAVSGKYLLLAHNSGFDRVAISSFLGMPVGHYLDPELWDDSMVRAANAGYPQGLDKLGKALGVKPKDSAGTLLINTFSKPNRKGGWNDSTTHSEKWEDFGRYCVNDVETMREACAFLPAQSSAERAVWLADQRINDRGVRADVPMAHSAIAAATENKEAARREVIELTGVENPGSVQQLLAWFSSQGRELGDMKKETVEEQLTIPELPADQRRVLQLRQELALSASAKYDACVNQVNSDGRLRGQTRYYGAHTGRWGGRGVQLQNLPRVSLGDREPLALLDLMVGLGASPHELKALVRPLLLGPLTVVDYSAIEARVLAWLAGEQWVLDAFREGQDLYVETARRFGPEFTRQHGKVAVLALGYGGSKGALRNMGAQGEDDELLTLVRLYRNANARIRQFWYDLWDAFERGGTTGRLTVRASRGIRRIELPSGREIVYRGVHRTTFVDEETGETRKAIAFRHPTGKTPKLWHGTIAENVTQAVARDLLAYCLPELERRGVPTVAHVHDEIIVDGDRLEELSEVMTKLPAWADGLPLDAEGHVVQRYTK